MTYAEQLKNPLWQKKRLDIFQRDKFTCQICLDTKETLNLHHKSYEKGKLAWEYEDSNFITLCETCHNELSEHIKKYGTEEEFDLMKVGKGKKVSVIIYSKGNVVIKQDDRWVVLGEPSVNKLVHFIINNWLKNG